MRRCAGPCGSQGDGEGTDPSVRGDTLGWCHPQKCPSSEEGRSCLPCLQQSPAAPSPAAGSAAREPSSPTAPLHFQRQKKPLGAQLHPYLSAAISWCRFSSKPTASRSHAPGSGHHHFTSISSPGTQESSWQLTKRRVTYSLGWALPFTQEGLTPVGMDTPARACCHFWAYPDLTRKKRKKKTTLAVPYSTLQSRMSA